MNEQKTSPEPPSAPAPSQEPKPWDRQDGESQDAFAAFTAYVNLGPRATLQDLFQELNPDPQNPKRTLKSIEQHCWRHNWRERAAARRQYEAQLQFKPLQKLLTDTATLWTQRAESMRQQQWEITDMLKDLAHQALKQVQEGGVQKPRYEEIPRIFNSLIKIARQSFELPAGPSAATAEQQAALHESEIALHKIFGRMAAEGRVPDVHQEINRERTQAPSDQPAQPPTTTPPASPTT